MRHKIGVVGSAAGYEAEILEKAREVGRLIAKYDCILLTGGTTGVSYEAVKGAKESKGLTIGFSPASNLEEHVKNYNFPSEYFDVLIFTGFGLKGRNVPFIRSSDGIVAISGRIGTLNEFTIAYDEKKTIGILEKTGGFCDDNGIRNFIESSGKKGGKIIRNSNPELLVKELIDNLNPYSNPL